MVLMPQMKVSCSRTALNMCVNFVYHFSTESYHKVQGSSSVSVSCCTQLDSKAPFPVTYLFAFWQRLRIVIIRTMIVFSNCDRGRKRESLLRRKLLTAKPQTNVETVIYKFVYPRIFVCYTVVVWGFDLSGKVKLWSIVKRGFYVGYFW